MRAISPCSSSTIAFGVPAGTSTPCMVSASWSLMPASSNVGTSGSAADALLGRSPPSARSLPALTSGIAGGIAWMQIGVWPATTDWIEGPPPGNGAMRDVEPERVLEQLAREMRRGADAG